MIYDDIRGSMERFESIRKVRERLLDSNQKKFPHIMLFNEVQRVPSFMHVVIVNGTGGAGKSTFVGMCREVENKSACISGTGTKVARVYETSAIDPVRQAADIMIKSQVCENEKYHTFLSEVCKDEKYRVLLSEMKQAWMRYDPNGPTRRIGEYINDIEEDINRSKDIQRMMINGPVTASILFVHIREPGEIQRLIDLIHSKNKRIGITTVLIAGRVDPDSHAASSDRNVNDYNYGFVIPNTGMEYELFKYADLLMTYCVNDVLEMATEDIQFSLRSYDVRVKSMDEMKLPGLV